MEKESKKHIFIPPVLAGVKMDAKSQKEIRSGNAIYKEGFTNNTTGEKFNAFVYYDEQAQKIKFSQENIPFIYRDLENYKHHFRHVLSTDIDRKNTTFYDVKTEIYNKRDVPQFTEIQVSALSRAIAKEKIDNRFEGDIVRAFQQTTLCQEKNINSFRDIQSLGDQIKADQVKKAQESQIFIPPVLAGVKMDAETQKEIRSGNAIYKEGFTNNTTGEKFNAFVYYSEKDNQLKFSRENPFPDIFSTDKERLEIIINQNFDGIYEIFPNNLKLKNEFLEKYNLSELVDDYNKLQTDRLELIKEKKYDSSESLCTQIELIKSDIAKTALSELEKLENSERSLDEKYRIILSDISKHGVEGINKHYYSNPKELDYVMDKYGLNNTYNEWGEQTNLYRRGSEVDIYNARNIMPILENKLKEEAGEALKKLGVQTKIEQPQEKKFSYPSFEEYKVKVPILQVAESLGYKIDEKSTSMRIQLRNDDGDLVLLSRGNANLYRNQKNELDKGSVVDFVKNRLDRFPAALGSKDWVEGVNKVLSGFMGVAYNFDETQKMFGLRETKVFNANDYPATPAKVTNLNYLIQERNLSPDTVKTFSPFIHMVGNLNNNYKNIGFPYTIPGEDQIRGYELRNYGTKEKGGFKGFTTGGDKVNAVWLANLAPDKADVKHIFFAESAIDAMSFYELNKHKFNMKDSVFVSTGGAIAQNQINNVIKEFPEAKIHGCFDADRAGQLYDISLACVAEKQTLTKILTPEGVQFKIGERSFEMKNEDISLANFEKQAGFKSSVEVHKPSTGKDFNEMLSKKNELNTVIKPKI